ncbi:MAG: hypothetical protein NUV78_00595 [Candidatus Zambryskibacteria bacterium]|nr:hypothetical protein [Candidatus Zambryskibacteria bacterium]
MSKGKISPKLLEDCVGKADCDCVDAAKEGIPCVHDLELAQKIARKREIETQREYQDNSFSNLGDGDLGRDR